MLLPPLPCSPSSHHPETPRDILLFALHSARAQDVAKAWLESQPRTKIETDTPGYLHAKSLSFLFGFPDSVGVSFSVLSVPLPAGRFSGFGGRYCRQKKWSKCGTRFCERRPGQQDSRVVPPKTRAVFYALLEFLFR